MRIPATWGIAILLGCASCATGQVVVRPGVLRPPEVVAEPPAEPRPAEPPKSVPVVGAEPVSPPDEKPPEGETNEVTIPLPDPSDGTLAYWSGAAAILLAVAAWLLRRRKTKEKTPMPLAEVFMPHLNATVKFGRTRPAKRGLEARPMTATMPPAPPVNTWDWSAKAADCLKNIYLNNQLGDCVPAGKAHALGVLTANGGTEVVCTDNDVLKMYEQDGGYQPGNPATDQGCNEQTALDNWEKNGVPIGGKRLLAWCAINPANIAAVEAMHYWFGPLIYGIELIPAWADSFKPGMVWDANGTPNPHYGHCVVGVARVTAPDGKPSIKVATWGSDAYLTDDASKQVVAGVGGELYSVFSLDWFNAEGVAPNGKHYTELAPMWTAATGQALPPSPFPPPVNPPTPPVNPPQPPVNPPTPPPIPDWIQQLLLALVAWLKTVNWWAVAVKVLPWLISVLGKLHAEAKAKVDRKS